MKKEFITLEQTVSYLMMKNNFQAINLEDVGKMIKNIVDDTYRTDTHIYVDPSDSIKNFRENSELFNLRRGVISCKENVIPAYVTKQATKCSEYVATWLEKTYDKCFNRNEEIEK